MAHDILIVDDETDIRRLIAGVLEDEGYGTREAADGRGALEALKARRPSLVVLDVWLQNSELDGLDLLAIMQREHPLVPVVMISGHGTIETAVSAIKLGAYDFVEKPFKADRLLLVVERAIEAAHLKRENEELRLRAGREAELIGTSSTLTHMLQAIDRVAPTNSRVLVTGPAGAGKEVVARLVHARSRRASGPFVGLSCATTRPERLEIELFGCEPGIEGRGALARSVPSSRHMAARCCWTRSPTLRSRRKARLSVRSRSRALSVSAATPACKSMVIASTNRDLAALMAAGRFREDLFYRLNVVPLRVPALKERRDDIPLLVHHFMQRMASSSGLSPRGISEDAMVALQTYDWPGNVRQLRNAVERLLIMAPGDPSEPIRGDMLPPDSARLLRARRTAKTGSKSCRCR